MKNQKQPSKALVKKKILDVLKLPRACLTRSRANTVAA